MASVIDQVINGPIARTGAPDPVPLKASVGAFLPPTVGASILPQLMAMKSLGRSTDPAQVASRPNEGDDIFKRNSKYVAAGNHSYNTKLSAQDESAFRQWTKANNVPFDPNAAVSDYDMRGFWSALKAGSPIAATAIDPNDKRMHYPDYWKTPYHESFSNESQWADPKTAPKWNEKDQLVAPDGSIIYDDRAPQRESDR